MARKTGRSAAAVVMEALAYRMPFFESWLEEFEADRDWQSPEPFPASKPQLSAAEVKEAEKDSRWMAAQIKRHRRETTAIEFVQREHQRTKERVAAAAAGDPVAAQRLAAAEEKRERKRLAVLQRQQGKAARSVAVTVDEPPFRGELQVQRSRLGEIDLSPAQRIMRYKQDERLRKRGK